MVSTMEFKYAKLPENPTPNDIKSEIERLKTLKADQGNKDQALKVILNSTYGVIGFKSFICYNRDVAQAVTKQSEDLIKYTIRFFNEYFIDHWHLDTDTHKSMGITSVRKIDHNVVNYADTDSIFLVLDKVRKTTDFKGDHVQFALELYKFALKGFIDRKLIEYIDVFHGMHFTKGTDRTLELAMEEVSHSVLWVKKKKYIKDTAYKKKIYYKSLESITVKGLELTQSSTPKFIRGKIKEFIEYVLANDKMHLPSLIKKLQAVKTEFSNVPQDDITKIERITHYSNYVRHVIVDGKPVVEFLPDCKPHTRGAGYYNHLLDINPQYKNIYDRIDSGNKVNWYYVKQDGKHMKADKNWAKEENSGATEKGDALGGLTKMDVFAYLDGQLPLQLAPELDKDKQFEVLYLGPINNILRTIGVKPFDASLISFPTLSW